MRSHLQIVVALFCLGIMHPVLAQSTEQKPEPQAAVEAPLPDIPSLMREVGANQRAAEQMKKKYTYRASTLTEETEDNGRVKKSESYTHEVLFLQGVRIERLIERNGKPLTEKEKEKEDNRISKVVEKAHEKHAKAEDKGQSTNSNGEEVLSPARILELGSFSHPRRELYKGRSTIVADYAGNREVKSRTVFEGAFKNLVGTVWIDEETRCLVRAEGHFLNSYKVGAGLVASVRQNTHFNVEWKRINNEVWLISSVDADGALRVLLFVHFQGRVHSSFSDYRKFQSSATILPGVTEVPDPPPAETPQP